MIRHRKRQPRDDDVRQRLARNINAHPKAVRPKQNASRRSLELLEQFSPRGAPALHQQIHFFVDEKLLQARHDLLHSAITREKNEGAPRSLLYKMRTPGGKRLII